MGEKKYQSINTFTQDNLNLKEFLISISQFHYVLCV